MPLLVGSVILFGTGARAGCGAVSGSMVESYCGKERAGADNKFLTALQDKGVPQQAHDKRPWIEASKCSVSPFSALLMPDAFKARRVARYPCSVTGQVEDEMSEGFVLSRRPAKRAEEQLRI